MFFFRTFLLILGLVSQGCAVLHHVQVGEIDNQRGLRLKKFEIKISETGVDLDEAVKIGKIFAGNKDSERLQSIKDTISLFQMGPRTGNPIWFVENYAKDLHKQVRAACKQGYITGLTSIRETRKYPVISGEIIKITGYCATKRG